MSISAQTALNGQEFGHVLTILLGFQLAFGAAYGALLWWLRRDLDLTAGPWPPLTTAVGVAVTLAAFNWWLEAAWPVASHLTVTAVLLYAFAAAGVPIAVIRVIEARVAARELRERLERQAAEIRARIAAEASREQT